MYLDTIISFRFLFFLKLFRRTVVRFSKNWLQVNINEIAFGSYCSWSAFVLGCLLQAYQLFPIAQQQISGRNLASKIFFFSSLEWWLNSFLVKQILFVCSVCLYVIRFFQQLWMLWVDVKKDLRVCFLSKYFGMEFFVFIIYFAI